MAASVNNVAATFATVPLSSSSSSPSSSSSSSSHLSTTPLPLTQKSFPLSLSHKPISISWNPHSNIPKSRRSSFLSVYGPPGPPPPTPFHSISTVHHQIIPKTTPLPPPIAIIGKKLPNAAVSFLDRNGKVQNVTVSSLGKGKKMALVGVSNAFSGRCERYVRGVEEAKARAVDVIACVAVNDVLVMRAWGNHLGVGEKVMMFSDVEGEVSRVLGLLCLGGSDLRPRLGLGLRSRRFCLSALNGVITNVSLDKEEDGDEDEIDDDEEEAEVDFVSRKINGSLRIN